MKNTLGQIGKNGLVGLMATAVIFTAQAKADTAPITQGQRVLSIGHSFHANWLPKKLKEVADSAGIKGHEIAGASMLPGSRLIEHWEISDDKHQAKEILTAGAADVCTMSPMANPDEGIEKFSSLALEHNPKIRILIQEGWLRYDKLEDPAQDKILRTWEDPQADPDKKKQQFNTAHFDVPSAAQLSALHKFYFDRMDAYVAGLNKKFGKQAVYIVPLGEAILALREKVRAGEVQGIKKQSELFADYLGHPKELIMVLSAYCHFAVIYRKSPVGLPVPQCLTKVQGIDQKKVNLLLQEIAWDAVTHHPMSGCYTGGPNPK